MRDNQMKYLLSSIVILAVVGLAWQGGWLTKAPATAAPPYTVATTIPGQPARCGDGVCQATESATSCATDCTSPMTLVCPSDGDSKFEVTVRDILNESGMNRLAVSVKKISSDGQLIDTDTSSSSGSTLMKVPCRKEAFTLIAYDDDNSGIDIYPAEVVVNAYKQENGVLAGGRIPVTINALQQGNLSIVIWDTSGGATTDKNLTFSAGETNPDSKFMVSETADDQAANAIVVLVNYTTSKIKRLEVTGSAPAGLTAKRCDNQIPSYYAGDGGFEAAYCLYQNGQPLILDADSRTATPDRAYFDVTMYAYGGTDPSQNTSWRVLDRMKYWEADGVTFAEGGEPATEDADNANLGIPAAGEMLDTLYLE